MAALSPSGISPPIKWATPTLLVTMAAALISCGGAAAPPLDDLLAFTHPASCTQAPEFQRLLASLHVIDSSGARYRLGAPSVPLRFASQVGKPVLEEGSDGEQIVTLPLKGSWRSLPVRAIERLAKAETDWLEEAIVFDASRDAVLKAANGAGFQLPASGKRTFGDELEMTIGVTGDEKTARLWCGT